MNPSRLFILRPVATSLLMVAILLSGIFAYRQLPLSALPEVDYPDHPGRDVLSGRESGRHDVIGDGAARTPVRADAGSEADVVDEFRRRVGDHAAVQSRPLPRRRRTGSAGRDQRRREFAAGGFAGAAGVQQGQSGRYAHTHAGRYLEHAAIARGAESRRHAARAEDFAGHRRRPGHLERRAASGRARAGEPQSADVERPESGGRAHRHRGIQREPGQGQLRRAAARLHDRRQRSDAFGRRIQPHRHRLPQRRADLSCGRRRRDRRRRERAARRVDERRAGGDHQHPAPAGGERHRGGRPRQAVAAAVAGRRCRRRSTSRC